MLAYYPVLPLIPPHGLHRGMAAALASAGLARAAIAPPERTSMNIVTVGHGMVGQKFLECLAETDLARVIRRTRWRSSTAAAPASAWCLPTARGWKPT